MPKSNYFELPDNDVELNKLIDDYNKPSQMKKHADANTNKILMNQFYVGTGTTLEREELRKHITSLIECNCHTLSYIINYTVQMGYQLDEIKRMVIEVTGINPDEVYDETNNEYYNFPGNVPGYNKGWGKSKDSKFGYYFVNPLTDYYCVYGQNDDNREEVEHFCTIDEALKFLKGKVKKVFTLDRIFSENQIDDEDYQEPSTNSQVVFTQNLSKSEHLKDQLKKNKISKASLITQANEFLTDAVISPEEFEDLLNYTNDMEDGQEKAELDFKKRFSSIAENDIKLLKRGEKVVLIDGTHATIEDADESTGISVKIENGSPISVSASDILYRQNSLKYIESKYSPRRELRDKIKKMASDGSSLDEVKLQILAFDGDTADSVNFTESDVERAFNKYADKLPGGLADEMSDDNFDEKSLKEGIKEEMSEHTKDPEIAKEIVKDHLTKNPHEYDKKVEAARSYYGDKYLEPESNEIYVFEKIDPNAFKGVGLMKYNASGKKLAHDIEWFDIDEVKRLLDTGVIKLLPKEFKFEGTPGKSESEDKQGESMESEEPMQDGGGMDGNFTKGSSLKIKADEVAEEEKEERKTKDNNDIFKERTPQDFFDNEIKNDFVGSVNKKINECLEALKEHIELIETYEIKIKKYVTDISDPETKDMTVDAADTFFSSDAMLSIIMLIKPKEFDVSYKKVLTVYTVAEEDISWDGTVKAENGNFYALSEEGLDDLFKKELQEAEGFDQETI